MANGVVCDLDLEVRALLAGLNSESAVVKFDVKIDGVGTKNEFSVEVENLAANTTFDVIIGRITVGQITTDGSGDGELKFSTDPGGGELPFPADFPLIKAKTKISIGTVLLGKFEKWQWV